MFESYLKEIIDRSDRLYYNYLGINRKEFPKWEGWKIINKYKENGVDIKDIDDETLHILVRNFYYIKFFKRF